MARTPCIPRETGIYNANGLFACCVDTKEEEGRKRRRRRIMCNVDNKKKKKKGKGKDIHKGRYTQDSREFRGISLGLYRLTSSWCSLEAENYDIVSVGSFSSPWTWSVYIYRLFFSFNLPPLPFLRNLEKVLSSFLFERKFGNVIFSMHRLREIR